MLWLSVPTCTGPWPDMARMTPANSALVEELGQPGKAVSVRSPVSVGSNMLSCASASVMWSSSVRPSHHAAAPARLYCGVLVCITLPSVYTFMSFGAGEWQGGGVGMLRSSGCDGR